MWETLLQLSLLPVFFFVLYVLPVMVVKLAVGDYRKKNRKYRASIHR